MTQQQFDKLPLGTTLYFVGVDMYSRKVTIENIKKSNLKVDRNLCHIYSTTKQGALANAMENYTKQISFHSQALAQVTELIKQYL